MLINIIIYFQTNKLTSSHITTITVCGEVIITILFIQASESEWLEISDEEGDDDDEADDDENEERDASQTDEDEEEVCTYSSRTLILWILIRSWIRL